MLGRINLEIERRKSLDENERLSLPSIFLVMTELDRVDEMTQVPTKYGTMEDSEMGKELKQIYLEGASLGIHVILSFEGVMPMKNTIGTKSLDYFRHRIALQMSEDDSFTFVRKRAPSKLQEQGAKPICAYYLDVNSNKDSTFKPYVVGNTLDEEIFNISNTLAKRMQYGNG